MREVKKEKALGRPRAVSELEHSYGSILPPEIGNVNRVGNYFKKTFITPIDRNSVRIVTFNPYLLRELWNIADRDDVVCISDKVDCGVYIVPSSLVPEVSGKALKKYVEKEEKDAGNQMGQIERGYV